MKKTVFLILSHVLCLGLGLGGGIYLLPILTAPHAPSESDVAASSKLSVYTGEFRKDLKDSDAFHWGEGTVYIDNDAISLKGKLAPGPDYKLYLSPAFVETEADFLRLKPRMVQVGNVKTFDNFIVSVPPAIDPRRYNSVIIWCESFGQFITAARYQ